MTTVGHTGRINKPERCILVVNQVFWVFTGSSSDMRDIHTAMHSGDEKAKLAYDIFQYLAVLNDCECRHLYDQ